MDPKILEDNLPLCLCRQAGSKCHIYAYIYMHIICGWVKLPTPWKVLHTPFFFVCVCTCVVVPRSLRESAWREFIYVDGRQTSTGGCRSSATCWKDCQMAFWGIACQTAISGLSGKVLPEVATRHSELQLTAKEGRKACQVAFYVMGGSWAACDVAFYVSHMCFLAVFLTFLPSTLAFLLLSLYDHSLRYIHTF